MRFLFLRSLQVHVALTRYMHSQSEHKIQSGKGSLHIEMDQVPKILKPLVAEWTREGFIVSFKVRGRLHVPIYALLTSRSSRRTRSC